MQENLVLRQLTNLPLQDRNTPKKDGLVEQAVDTQVIVQNRASLDQMIYLSCKQVDFGLCLPGSIHQTNFSITLQKQLEQATQLSVFIVCQDQTLFDSSSLVFGIKKIGQNQFYDDYRMKVKNKKSYQFKIGVKTPMFYQYDVKCTMYISFMDYAPLAVTMKQKIQIPQIICTKELQFCQQRVIKLAMVQARGKKQCRIPFKMNHQMSISVTAQIIGLEYQAYPLIDVKPKSMTLNGKGQFSLLVMMNTSQQIRQCLSLGVPTIIRRILVLKIKQSKFNYHFPIQISYYSGHKKGVQFVQQI